MGLGYLTLNRLSNTLSGGESQRINLATSLGSSLVGSLYILDEPSIGLHSRDTDKLIRVLRQLQQLGNTVIVVEHDEEIIRAADYIIDIGPNAGRLGGEVVFQGDLKKMLAEKPQDTRSYTVKYLTGQETIPLPDSPRPWNNYIKVKGARANNLRGIDVSFPLNVMTVVTGVSGSGKSTLVRDIFFRAMKRQFDEVADRPGEFLGLEGDLDMVRNIEFVDQNPIGKSSRSNPVTYIKAYDEIRKLFAEQPLAKQMGFTAGYFSFNTEGGRCEECKGEGTVTVEMQFMADLVLECESCHGKRFKSDILEVKFEGQNIYDVLNMTVNQAIEFFDAHKQDKISKSSSHCRTWAWATSNWGNRPAPCRAEKTSASSWPTIWAWRRPTPPSSSSTNPPPACTSTTSEDCWRPSTPSSCAATRSSSSSTTWTSSNAPTTLSTSDRKADREAETWSCAGHLKRWQPVRPATPGASSRKNWPKPKKTAHPFAQDTGQGMRRKSRDAHHAERAPAKKIPVFTLNCWQPAA